MVNRTVLWGKSESMPINEILKEENDHFWEYI